RRCGGGWARRPAWSGSRCARRAAGASSRRDPSCRSSRRCSRASRRTDRVVAETYVQERAKTGRKDLRYPEAPEPLAVPVYDNHCHLDIHDGDEHLTLAQQRERAGAVGIAGVVQSSGDIESSRWAVAAAEQDDRVLAAVAIHPNDAP